MAAKKRTAKKSSAESPTAKKPTQTPRKAQDLVRERAELEKRMQEAATHASILFADMVGSTAFKTQNEALVALEKPDTHHQAVCKVVQKDQHGGKVIKSMGDGIMVMFDGENCERRAIAAGLEVLTTLRECNKGRTAKKDDAAILTRIGIDSGPVWTFSFPQSFMDDPQGTTVDVAARLCALAEAEQLLCTEEETFKLAGGQETFNNVGKPGRRFLKGVPDRLCIRMVLPDAEGWNPERVPVSGYRPPILETRKKELDDACALFVKGDRKSLSDAYKAFASIVEDDPNSVEAHLGLSRILLTLDTEDLEVAKACRSLREHLAFATQGQPNYYGVWLLVGLARLMRFKHHSRDVKDLDEAIKHTETARALASQGLDVAGILDCKIQLARLLLARAQRAGTDDGADDLSRAGLLCTEAMPIFSGHMERTERAYALTDIRIRVAQGKDLEDLEQRLKAMLQDDDDNPDVHSALAELLTKRKRLPKAITA